MDPSVIRTPFIMNFEAHLLPSKKNCCSDPN
jgi:hypothetical protein